MTSRHLGHHYLLRRRTAFQTVFQTLGRVSAELECIGKASYWARRRCNCIFLLSTLEECFRNEASGYRVHKWKYHDMQRSCLCFGVFVVSSSCHAWSQEMQYQRALWVNRLLKEYKQRGKHLYKRRVNWVNHDVKKIKEKQNLVDARWRPECQQD